MHFLSPEKIDFKHYIETSNLLVHPNLGRGGDLNPSSPRPPVSYL